MYKKSVLHVQLLFCVLNLLLFFAVPVAAAVISSWGLNLLKRSGNGAFPVSSVLNYKWLTEAFSMWGEIECGAKVKKKRKSEGTGRGRSKELHLFLKNPCFGFRLPLTTHWSLNSTIYLVRSIFVSAFQPSFLFLPFWSACFFSYNSTCKENAISLWYNIHFQYIFHAPICHFRANENEWLCHCQRWRSN